MKQIKFLTAVLAASSILAVASASVLAGYSFKRAVKEGDKYSYTLKGDLEVAGMSVTLTGKASEKVTKVEADKYTIESTQSDTKVNVGGQEMAQPDRTETEIRTITGKIIELKSEQVSPESYRLSNLNAFVTPDKEINIGETWTATFKADEKTGAVDAKTEYKYVGDEKVGDWDTAKVEAVAKETKDSSAQINTTYWISKVDGSVVRSVSKLKEVMMAGVPAPLNGTIEQKREG